MFILADLDTTENVKADQKLLGTKLTTTINTEDLCYLRDQLQQVEIHLRKLRAPSTIWNLEQAQLILEDLLNTDEVF
jgi:hypothetical protein